MKWNREFKVANVSATSEEDVFFYNALNTNMKVWATNDPNSRRLDVEGNLLDVPGFFGFIAHFRTVPEEEQPVSFKVQIKFEDGYTEDVVLPTKIVRPILVFDEAPPEIYVESATSLPRPPPVVMVNRGSSEVLYGSLKAVAKTTQGPNLSISSITSESEFLMDEQPFGGARKYSSSISIKGIGYGAILVSFEYRDNMGNVYYTPIIKILVSVKQRANLEVPMSGTVKESPPFVIAEPIPA